MFVYNGNTSAWEQVAVSTSGFPTLAGNNDFTGLNTFTNAGTADVFRITNTGTGYSLLVEDSTNPDSTPFIVDHLGRLIIGNNGYPTAGSGAFLESIVGTGTGYPLALYGMYASTAGGRIAFHKSRSTAIGTYTAVNSGDTLGDLVFYGDDGTAWQNSAMIRANASDTPSSGIVSGRLSFWTTDSTGTLTERMRILSSGAVSINSTSATLGSSSTAHQLGVVIGATTTVGAVIRAATSQSADLTQWQDSAGTNLARVKSDGTILTNYLDSVSQNGAYLQLQANAGILINGRATAGVTLITRAVASQTADIQQWQNSAGTVLARVDSSGNIVASAANFSTSNNFLAGVSFGSTSGTGTRLYVNTPNSGLLLQGYDSGGTGRVLLTVQGRASQTANLQEWQNSGGTVLASVNAAGQFVGDGSQLTGISAGVTTAALEEVEQQVIMGALL
jgi:hypothetical protein